MVLTFSSSVTAGVPERSAGRGTWAAGCSTGVQPGVGEDRAERAGSGRCRRVFTRPIAGPLPSSSGAGRAVGADRGAFGRPGILYGSAGPESRPSLADTVKSPYYQAVRQRSSTLRYVLADLTKSPAGAAIYAALAELERLAALLPLAPGLADRMGVAEVIAQRHERYRELLGRFGEAGDPQSAMAAAAPALDDARRRVESTDWWEALAATLLGAALTDELFEILVGRTRQVPAAVASSAGSERG